MARRAVRSDAASITGVFGAGAPCFVVDPRQRVVAWSEGAARATGLRPSDALGRRCWEARTGRASSRRPAECRGCLPVGDRAGTSSSGECVPLPLPARPDQALVWLLGDGGSVPGLLLLGALSSVLSRDVFSSGLDRALEILRRACRADDAELFLAEPGGTDVVMVAHNGIDRDAFLERDRFGPGDGYPGAVLASGRTLVSPDLSRDGTFRRRAVCEAGVRRYECVPVPGPLGPLGALSLAWRVPERAPAGASETLVESARVVGMAVAAGLAARREAMEAALGETDGVEQRARACLEALRRAAGASGATLLVVDEGARAELTVTVGRPPTLPHGFARAEQWLWARLREGHGFALGGDDPHLPKSFRDQRRRGAPSYCLPLIAEGRLLGAIVLEAREPSEVPSGPLVPLLAMASEAALHLAKPLRASPPTAEKPAPAIDLRCFGPFEVRLGGRLVPNDSFARKKALTLLKLLVLRAGNPVARDELCALLWPEASGKSVLKNRLHVTVHALRAAIEPFHAEQRWLFVRNEGDLYYFDTDVPHRIDLFELERLSSLAFRARDRGDLHECLALGEKAASLYRGDLFADEPYADWCILERTNAERRFLDLTRKLAAVSSELGEHDRAAEWLRRGLRVEPREEDLHRGLIELLARLGRRVEALAQYHVCERILRDELGVSPMPETRRLGRLLLDQRSPAPRDPV